MPLSTPSKPATVDVALVLGSIHVAPGKAGEVLVEARAGEDDEDEDDGIPVAGRAKDKSNKEGKTLEGGLRRITTSSVDITVEEEGNEVSVRSGGSSRQFGSK